MRSVITIKTQDMFPIIDEILEEKGSAWITVTGTSMYPFLRAGKDQVKLVRCSFDTVKAGDIVLIKREISGQYVLHRVLKKESSSLYIIGDAQQWIEGPIKPDQLIASVAAIRRNKHVIKCSCLLLKFLVKLWRIAIPVRYKILKVIGRLATICRKMCKRR